MEVEGFSGKQFDRHTQLIQSDTIMEFNITVINIVLMLYLIKIVPIK